MKNTQFFLKLTAMVLPLKLPFPKNFSIASAVQPFYGNNCIPVALPLWKATTAAEKRRRRFLCRGAIEKSANVIHNSTPDFRLGITSALKPPPSERRSVG